MNKLKLSSFALTPMLLSLNVSAGLEWGEHQIDCVQEIGNIVCGPLFLSTDKTIECGRNIKIEYKQANGVVNTTLIMPGRFLDKLRKGESHQQFLERAEPSIIAGEKDYINIRACSDANTIRYQSGGLEMPRELKFDLGTGSGYAVFKFPDKKVATLERKAGVWEKVASSTIFTIFSFFAGADGAYNDPSGVQFSTYHYLLGDEMRSTLAFIKSEIIREISLNGNEAEYARKEGSSSSADEFTSRQQDWENVLTAFESAKTEAIVRTDILGNNYLFKLQNRGWFLFRLETASFTPAE